MISILVVVVISLISSQKINSLISYAEQVSRTDKVINLLTQIEKQLINAENSQRGFYVTKDTSYLLDFKDVRSNIFQTFDSLKKVITVQDHRNDLVKIKSSAAARLQTLQESFDYAKLGDMQKFEVSVIRGKSQMNDFKNLTQKFEQKQSQLLTQSEAEKKRFEITAPVYLRLIFVISILFQIVALVLIVREFRQRHQYQKDLERKVNELNMSHSELEQIAFIASHDLQEPLRKMRTFGGRLLMQYKETLNESGQMMLSRIDFAARRMQGLIEDLVDYTHLINSTEERKLVSLNECVEEVKNSLANLFQNRKVSLEVAELPSIEGYPFQLHLLFTNLIHNSIKFSKTDEAPVINITYDLVHGEALHLPHGPIAETFIKISVTDNGIGFENEFAKKIFVMFQRLHNQHSSYGGKGIGLSICKRVMTNHNGHIDAEGQPGQGATFNLYFPTNIN